MIAMSRVSTSLTFLSRYFMNFISLNCKILVFLIVVDDKSFAFDNVTHVIWVLFMIRNHLETIEFYVTKLEYYLVILSMSLLRAYTERRFARSQKWRSVNKIEMLFNHDCVIRKSLVTWQRLYLVFAFAYLL